MENLRIETGLRIQPNHKTFPPQEETGKRKDLVDLFCDKETFERTVENHHMSIWDV